MHASRSASPPTAVVCFDYGDTLVSYALATSDGQLQLLEAFWSSIAPTLLIGYPKAQASLQRDLHAFCVRLNTERPDHSVWPFVARLRDESFLGPSVPERVASLIEEALCSAVFATASIISGAHEALLDLKNAGCVTGIMSNLPWGTSAALWRTEILRHGLDAGVVDYVVLCGDVGFRKPHPAGLIELKRVIGDVNDRWYFVGDRLSDAEAAAAAGWEPILVAPNPPQGAIDRPTWVRSLDQLSQVILNR